MELEDDLRLLLAAGVEAARERIGEPRLLRARRAAAYLARHHEGLRERGLLSFGERPERIHLAPALEEALSRQLSAVSSDPDPAES